MEYQIKSVELSNHVKLPYVDQGDPAGVPLLLLHGYADSWRAFELVLPFLPDSVHTIALTQRGHGESSRPLEGYRPSDQAADVAELLDALERYEADDPRTPPFWREAHLTAAVPQTPV